MVEAVKLDAPTVAALQTKYVQDVRTALDGSNASGLRREVTRLDELLRKTNPDTELSKGEVARLKRALTNVSLGANQLGLNLEFAVPDKLKGVRPTRSPADVRYGVAARGTERLVERVALEQGLTSEAARRLAKEAGALARDGHQPAAIAEKLKARLPMVADGGQNPIKAALSQATPRTLAVEAAKGPFLGGTELMRERLAFRQALSDQFKWPGSGEKGSWAHQEIERVARKVGGSFVGMNDTLDRSLLATPKQRAKLLLESEAIRRGFDIQARGDFIAKGLEGFEKGRYPLESRWAGLVDRGWKGLQATPEHLGAVWDSSPVKGVRTKVVNAAGASGRAIGDLTAPLRARLAFRMANTDAFNWPGEGTRDSWVHRTIRSVAKQVRAQYVHPNGEADTSALRTAKQRATLLLELEANRLGLLTDPRSQFIQKGLARFDKGLNPLESRWAGLFGRSRQGLDTASSRLRDLWASSVKSVNTSVGGAARATGNAIRHPIDTVRGLTGEERQQNLRTKRLRAYYTRASFDPERAPWFQKKLHKAALAQLNADLDTARYRAVQHRELVQLLASQDRAGRLYTRAIAENAPPTAGPNRPWVDQIKATVTREQARLSTLPRMREAIGSGWRKYGPPALWNSSPPPPTVSSGDKSGATAKQPSPTQVGPGEAAGKAGEKAGTPPAKPAQADTAAQPKQGSETPPKTQPATAPARPGAGARVGAGLGGVAGLGFGVIGVDHGRQEIEQGRVAKGVGHVASGGAIVGSGVAGVSAAAGLGGATMLKGGGVLAGVGMTIDGGIQAVEGFQEGNTEKALVGTTKGLSGLAVAVGSVAFPPAAIIGGAVYLGAVVYENWDGITKAFREKGPVGAVTGFIGDTASAAGNAVKNLWSWAVD